ncbi:hypothetical protein ADUPG1_013061 [Aduncisulcus paluster]|uniref:Uncharacterized protein n=1 Tax=Aduncisulcus paluster TaxID=2918883 RepID=A0ABQ5K1M2_9EUKA|nr:hypothetical protein ADUPG1_013061 [Aduncisulcus paluster]
MAFRFYYIVYILTFCICLSPIFSYDLESAAADLTTSINLLEETLGMIYDKDRSTALLETLESESLLSSRNHPLMAECLFSSIKEIFETVASAVESIRDEYVTNIRNYYKNGSDNVEFSDLLDGSIPLSVDTINNDIWTSDNGLIDVSYDYLSYYSVNSATDSISEHPLMFKSVEEKIKNLKNITYKQCTELGTYVEEFEEVFPFLSFDVHLTDGSNISYPAFNYYDKNSYSSLLSRALSDPRSSVLYKSLVSLDIPRAFVIIIDPSIPSSIYDAINSQNSSVMDMFASVTVSLLRDTVQFMLSQLAEGDVISIVSTDGSYIGGIEMGDISSISVGYEDESISNYSIFDKNSYSSLLSRALSDPRSSVLYKSLVSLDIPRAFVIIIDPSIPSSIYDAINSQNSSVMDMFASVTVSLLRDTVQFMLSQLAEGDVISIVSTDGSYIGGIEMGDISSISVGYEDESISNYSIFDTGEDPLFSCSDELDATSNENWCSTGAVQVTETILLSLEDNLDEYFSELETNFYSMINVTSQRTSYSSASKNRLVRSIKRAHDILISSVDSDVSIFTIYHQKLDNPVGLSRSASLIDDVRPISLGSPLFLGVVSLYSSINAHERQMISDILNNEELLFTIPIFLSLGVDHLLESCLLYVSDTSTIAGTSTKNEVCTNGKLNSSHSVRSGSSSNTGHIDIPESNLVNMVRLMSEFNGFYETIDIISYIESISAADDSDDDTTCEDVVFCYNDTNTLVFSEVSRNMDTWFAEISYSILQEHHLSHCYSIEPGDPLPSYSGVGFCEAGIQVPILTFPPAQDMHTGKAVINTGFPLITPEGFFGTAVISFSLEQYLDNVMDWDGFDTDHSYTMLMSKHTLFYHPITNALVENGEIPSLHLIDYLEQFSPSRKEDHLKTIGYSSFSNLIDNIFEDSLLSGCIRPITISDYGDQAFRIGTVSYAWKSLFNGTFLVVSRIGQDDISTFEIPTIPVCEETENSATSLANVQGFQYLWDFEDPFDESVDDSDAELCRFPPPRSSEEEEGIRMEQVLGVWDQLIQVPSLWHSYGFGYYENDTTRYLKPTLQVDWNHIDTDLIEYLTGTPMTMDSTPTSAQIEIMTRQLNDPTLRFTNSENEEVPVLSSVILQRCQLLLPFLRSGQMASLLQGSDSVFYTGESQFVGFATTFGSLGLYPGYYVPPSYSVLTRSWYYNSLPSESKLSLESPNYNPYIENGITMKIVHNIFFNNSPLISALIELYVTAFSDFIDCSECLGVDDGSLTYLFISDVGNILWSSNDSYIDILYENMDAGTFANLFETAPCIANQLLDHKVLHSFDYLSEQGYIENGFVFDEDTTNLPKIVVNSTTVYFKVLNEEYLDDSSYWVSDPPIAVVIFGEFKGIGLIFPSEVSQNTCEVRVEDSRDIIVVDTAFSWCCKSIFLSVLNSIVAGHSRTNLVNLHFKLSESWRERGRNSWGWGSGISLSDRNAAISTNSLIVLGLLCGGLLIILISFSVLMCYKSGSYLKKQTTRNGAKNDPKKL